MQDCISAIYDYTSDVTAHDFENDGKTLDAVLRRLEVLGEAAGRLIKAGNESGYSFPSLPLREMYDMRNALIHGYDAVDVSVGWKTIARDIPQLRQAVLEELKILPEK